MVNEPIRTKLLAVTVIMAALLLLMTPSCTTDWPVIRNLTAEADWVAPGGSTWLECSALGSDGLIYRWSASEGGFSGTGARVQWNAPQQVGMYDITVTVANAEGREATASITLTVSDGPPPEIQNLVVTADHKYLKETSTGYRVATTYKYDIECIASSADGEIVYEWSCDDGEITDNSEDGSTVIWTAPNDEVPVTVTVKVLDGAGNWIKRSITFQVVSCEGCHVW
ncbi:MAG: hypothetical protein ACNA7X_03545 [Dehalococcoidia bacterium]